MELEPIELTTDEASAAPSSAPSASAANPTTSPDPFDLEAYIARYDPASETRLQRLLLIGSHCSSSGGSGGTARDTSQAVAARAYRLAERQCRDAANVRTYRQVFGGGQQSATAATAAGAGAAGSGSGGTFGKSAFRYIRWLVCFAHLGLVWFLCRYLAWCGRTEDEILCVQCASTCIS